MADKEVKAWVDIFGPDCPQPQNYLPLTLTRIEVKTVLPMPHSGLELGKNPKTLISATAKAG